MPCFITFGAVNSNTPQQNAGVFIGEINCGGWDANQKQNLGHGALYGFFNVTTNIWSAAFDGNEWLDGLILDQDFKPLIGSNF